MREFRDLGKVSNYHFKSGFFLSEECRDIIAKSKSSIYTIGYDISIEKGLGRITFDMLSTTGKNNFFSSPIFDFTDEKAFPRITSYPVEEVELPLVVAKNLAAN